MKPLAINMKRYFSYKELAIVLIAIVVSISVGVVVFLNLKKEVLINDDGRQIMIKTMKTTLRDVLDQSGIKIGEYDYISLPLDAKLQKMKVNKVDIKRAIQVNIVADGVKTTVMTCKDTVEEVLKDSPVKLSELDKLDGVSPGDKIYKDMEIKVIRVKENYITESISIPYNVITKENNRMDKGKSRVVREGKEGVRQKVYRVVFEDGKEVLREMVKDVVALAPVNKIVEFGTVLNFTTSRGEIVRYKKVLDMRATAYTASFKDTGKHPGDPGFGITYTGMKARKGVIAVDPKVIPLGARVYIEGVGSVPDYGFAVAADIGSAVKGNKIDLYFDDQKTVDRWGIKKVRVYILNE